MLAMDTSSPVYRSANDQASARRGDGATAGVVGSLKPAYRPTWVARVLTMATGVTASDVGAMRTKSNSSL